MTRKLRKMVLSQLPLRVEGKQSQILNSSLESIFLNSLFIESTTEGVYKFYVPGAVYTTLHFLPDLMNWPNELECYITLGFI